jgi:D-aminoacyl-tRNA deacylase
MRAVIQRVKKAAVFIDGNRFSFISAGILVLIGIEATDEMDDISWLSGKICRLRIFDDEAGVMNLSLQDIGGEVLIVSQFTLHASTKKGNRPSYIKASGPEFAIHLYNQFVEQVQLDLGRSVQTGKFGAMMQVELVNDGPVTILMDTKNKE